MFFETDGKSAKPCPPSTQGHRGRTFVILLPGEITASPELLHPLIEDIGLLHGASRFRRAS